jgi:DNA-binding HxlR family transcriptional regulator
MAVPAHSTSIEGAGRPSAASAEDLRGRSAGIADAAQPPVCPYFHQAVELLGKRWNGAIVHALLPGPQRFCELGHTVPDISDRLLSMRLRELEAAGIVVRDVQAGAPVRVLYALTERGQALEPAIEALRGWAREWLAPDGACDGFS